MSGLQFVRFLIDCHGCGAIYGTRAGFESLAAARAAAYADGWRFPPWLTVKGTPSSSAADVCPECMPSWQPKRAADRATSHRALSAADVGLLPE